MISLNACKAFSVVTEKRLFFFMFTDGSSIDAVVFVAEFFVLPNSPTGTLTAPCVEMRFLPAGAGAGTTSSESEAAPTSLAGGAAHTSELKRSAPVRSVEYCSYLLGFSKASCCSCTVWRL